MDGEWTLVRPGEIETDVTGRVRLEGQGAPSPIPATQAEEGGVGSGEVIIDDPLGNLMIYGGTTLRYREPLSEHDDPYLYSGGIGARDVIRGPSDYTGSARQWKCTLFDGNSGLVQMVFRPGEVLERPAETAGERLEWLVTTVPMSNLTDHRYMDFTDTTQMDKADYTRQNPLQVMGDCAQQSGFDYGVIYAGDTEQYAPFYMAPDSDVLDMPVRVSNIIADVNGDVDGNTFYMDRDAALHIDDDRVASGILGIADGIEVFRQNTPTAVQFSRRDKVMDAPNVKTLPVLRARVLRWLSDFDSEEYTATMRVQVPAAKASYLKAQYRIQVRASHWPNGYDQWTWVRILSATPEQVTDGGYIVALEVGFPKPAAVAAGNATARLDVPYGSVYTGGNVIFRGTGDNPRPGMPTAPLTGLLEYIEFDENQWTGVRATGAGDLNIRFTADDIAGVVGDVTCTPAILKNGTIVASDPHATPDPNGGFPYSHSVSWDFSADVSVVDGDEITFSFVSSWNGVAIPAGTGMYASVFVNGDLA